MREKREKKHTSPLPSNDSSGQNNSTIQNTILDAMQDGIYIVNANYDIEYINPAFRTLFGNYESLKCYQYIQGRDEICLECPLPDVLAGQSVRQERYNAQVDRTFDQIKTQIRNADGSISMMSIFRDVTERKKVEQRIKRQSILLESINRIFGEYLCGASEVELAKSCLEIAQDLTGSKFSIINMIGSDGLLYDLAVSDEAFKVCDMMDKTGHRKSNAYKINGLYGQVVTSGESLLTNEPSKHPASIGTPRGHVKLTSFLGVPLIYNGSVIGLLGLANKVGGYTSIDLDTAQSLAPAIIEAIMRNRAEVALYESEAYAQQKADDLDILMNTAPVAIWTAFDPECKVVKGNETANRLMEIKDGQNVSIIAMQEQKVKTRHRFFRGGRELSVKELPLCVAAMEGRELKNVEMEIATPSGKTVILLGHARPLFDTNGNVRGAISTFMDITLRKKAEIKIAELLGERSEKLRQSETNFQVLVHTMAEGVLVLDKKNCVKFANPAAEALFDLSKKELAGQQLGLLVNEGAFEIELPAGESNRIIEVNSVPIQWGEDFGHLITLRDVTQQKRAHERIRDLSHRVVDAQEKERRFIGHELHDEVGGSLTAIKLAIARIGKRMGGSYSEEFKKVSELLDDTMDLVSSLSQKMRPDILDQFGLLEALNWYFERYISQTGIKVNFNHNLDEERYTSVIEITAYRVVQECLTNAARYSGSDSVTVNMHKDLHKLYIKVEDCGKGFNPTKVDKSGITGMKDRALLAGGELSVESSQGMGTRVICELPLADV